MIYNFASIILGIGLLISTCLSLHTNFGKLMHFFYFGYLPYVAFAWFMGALMLFGNFFLIDSCEIVQNLTSGETKLRDLEFFNRASVTPLQTCLEGQDSDFAKAIGFIKALDADIDIINQLDVLQPYMISFPEKESVIALSEAINACKNFSKVALDPETVPDDNPDISLENFNKWSDFSVSGTYQDCQKTQDNWVHDLSQCRYSNIFDKTETNYTKDFGEKIRISPENATSITRLQLDRYNALRLSGCSTHDNPYFQNLQSLLMAYYSSHKSYVSSLKTVLTKLQDDVNTFTTRYDKYNKDLKNFLKQFEDIQSNATNLIEYINGTQGFLKNSDCRFINRDLNLLANNVCYGILPEWTEMMIYHTVLSLVSIYSSFKIFGLLKRFSVKLGYEKTKTKALLLRKGSVRAGSMVQGGVQLVERKGKHKKLEIEGDEDDVEILKEGENEEAFQLKKTTKVSKEKKKK